MPYRRIAPDVKQDILSSLKSGKTVSEMSELHAVSEQTIYGWLSKSPDESVSRLEYNKLRRKYEEALQIIGELTQESIKKKRRGKTI